MSSDLTKTVTAPKIPKLNLTKGAEIDNMQSLNRTINALHDHAVWINTQIENGNLTWKSGK